MGRSLIYKVSKKSDKLANNAIHLDQVHFAYKSTVTVIDNISMNVPRGQIYGLLGSSGCGKTSLIRLILGIRQPTSGKVNVFGKRPGLLESSIPGPMVGYMPQDFSLYEQLTIEETLKYFGSLYNLSYCECKERVNFLVKFLQLPNENRLVSRLSGGQMRRVSLAIALIHRPPLLILDEPTVGVDPLLRQSIWNYLSELSQKDGLTVLVTTHYIDEAKQANLVGFIRDGKLLAENSPNELLQRYQVETLEQVFLCLCNKSNDDRLKTKELQSIEPIPVVKSQQYELKVENTTPFRQTAKWLSIKHIRAMISKNLLTFSRSIGYLMFQFMLPFIQAVLFCICLGGDLRFIPVAIYDGDQSLFSEAILNDLNSTKLAKNYYPNESLAMNSVQMGEHNTAIIINEGYFDSLFDRVMQIETGDHKTLNKSVIHIYSDMSIPILAQFIQGEVLRSFQRVANEFLHNFTVSENASEGSNLLEMPIRIETPIYGKIEPMFINFISPGVIISIAFFLPVSLTSMAMVVERNRGLMERTMVVGVSHIEILISQLVTNMFIAMAQVAILLITCLGIFGIEYQGHLYLVAILAFLQSLNGMTFGMAISTIADTENTATMLALGIFYPILVLSGVLWPIEAMHQTLRYVSYCIPLTMPIRAMRSIMSRGWDLDKSQVVGGFLASFGWIIGVFIISIQKFYYHNGFINIDCWPSPTVIVNLISKSRYISKFVEKLLKKCHVCGDVALSFNFNAISCESCRFFFRRYAHKNNELKCKFNTGRCVISSFNRRCQRCRMDKCLSVGMKLELVDKRKGSTNSKPKTECKVVTAASSPFQLRLQLYWPITSYCYNLIENICQVFRSFHPQLVGYVHDSIEIFNIQEFFILAMIKFVKTISQFQQLKENDQLFMVKTSFADILMLRSLFYFDFVEDSFPMRLDENAEHAVSVPLKRLYPNSMNNLIELHRDLASKVASNRDDNVMRDLMSVLTMLRPKQSYSCPDYIRYEFIKYRCLLEQYLAIKYDDRQVVEQLMETLFDVIENVTKLKKIFYEIYSHVNVCNVSHSLLEIYDV